MIELDLSVPWNPPEPVLPPRKRGRPWIALAAVSLMSAAVLAAGAPPASTAPEYRLDDVRILDLQAAGGRVIVSRYEPEAPGSRAEVRRLRDGALLWSTPLAVGERLGFLSERVVARMSDEGGAATVFDAATGDQLWEAPRLSVIGRAAGLLITEDLPEGSPQIRTVIITSDGQLAPNQAIEQVPRRYRALDERTGKAVWTLEPPVGSIAEAGDDGMWVLSPDGRLETHDLATGAVTATRRLAWSGTLSWYSMGDDGVMVATAGQVGIDVFDRESGRLLWRWPATGTEAVPYACAAGLYCLRDGTGMAALDPRTGERRWHLDGYNGALGSDGRTVLVTDWGFGSPANAEQPIAAVDARTGRKRWELTGWRITTLLRGNRIVVWRPTGGDGAVLAAVDPETGRLALIGRATVAHRDVSCVQDDGRLACVTDGILSVWPLPR
ncbi:PQQ-binding-like beta-propeller repeat protein [Dactylosporangium sp. AC04546]|uniref:outer membrane protein assembly factor BamB family protein n=1 Tax=Dactylosporangium sp. AC04546 TaxID=2862460 RepID=UPI001EDEE9BA|nr:PQQ-binding-like beta-propeller repeat protein [Dactylosporangium sp. AC04546]WVK88459.1 PQQ-binding-like beta-propeller repeat protein [Dactylosporangium sp. AC04546]